MTAPPPRRRPAAGPGRAGLQLPPTQLVRITINLTQPTGQALDHLVRRWRSNKTDVINRSVRMAERLDRLTVDGHLTIRVHDREVEVHLI